MLHGQLEVQKLFLMFNMILLDLSQELEHIVGVTGNTYSITGLTSLTSYDVWVQADCGTDSSNYIGPFTFTTPCSAITAPYSENFDAATLSSCWIQNLLMMISTGL